MRTIARFLLDKRVSLVGNLSFIVGALLAGVKVLAGLGDLLTAVIVVFLGAGLALMLAPPLARWSRRRRGMGPSDAPVVRSSASVVGLKLPGPTSSDVPAVSFTTNGQGHRFLGTKGKPQALRFTAPRAQTVRSADLPARIRHRRMTVLLVKRFTDDGFAIEEKTSGVDVRAEIYYAEDSAAPLRKTA